VPPIVAKKAAAAVPTPLSLRPERPLPGGTGKPRFRWRTRTRAPVARPLAVPRPVERETEAPAPAAGKRLLHACAVGAAFTALTVLMAYPLSVSPAHRAVNLGADTRLFVWTLGWDLHALAHQPLAIFDANIFFPNHHTLAYSENLFGVSLFAAPWLALSGSPLVAVNMAALLSCVLCGLGVYALARELKISVVGALVAGVIFAFSPPRFFRLGQLHLTSVQWIPFCLLFLHRYLDGGRRRHLLAAAALFTVQATFSGHGAVFLGMSALALVLYHAVVCTSFSWLKLARDAGASGLLLVALSAPLAWPYLAVERERGFQRSFEEAEDGSPNAVSYLASPSHFQRLILSLTPAGAAAEQARAFLFPGYLTLILAAMALRRRPPTVGGADAPAASPGSWVGKSLEWAAFLSALGAILIWRTGGVRFDLGGVVVSAHSIGRAWVLCGTCIALRLVWTARAPLAVGPRWERWRAAMRGWSERHGGAALSFYVVLTALGLWASAGPRLGLYAVLYYVPGFNFIRIPSRIMVIALLGLAVLAGAGVDRLRAWLPFARSTRFAALLLGLLVAELAAFPIKAPPYAVDVPEVDRWIGSQTGTFAIAEMPVPDPDRGGRSDAMHGLYMLHSMAHWQKTVSGYSGFRPLGHAALYRTLMHFPDEPSLRALRNLGVKYVVVHRDFYRAADLAALEERLEQWGGSLRLEHAAGEGRVYSVREDATGVVARRFAQ
jgi:hypothetical protein